MEAALHDPDHGYYARRISAVGGPRADFTTAPMLSGAPARAIAAQLFALHRDTGIRDAVDVNFDDLIHWGEQLGLETASIQPLGDFLAPQADPSSSADQQLLAPHGAAGAFQVLLQSRSRSRQTSG